jgi:hypothetical protein
LNKGSILEKLIVILSVCLLVFGHANALTNEDLIEMQGSQSTKKRIDDFVRRMKNWGQHYGDLAGCEDLGLAYDSEIKGERMLIGGGDWAVFDRRLCSGAYGVSHEDGSIISIELNDPKAHDTHCFKPTITSSVDAITLMQRYQWFNALFINWAHVLTPSPLGVGKWKGFEQINADYAKEVQGLAHDPHLALYWLMHFGFTLDERYNEVKAIIEDHRLAQRLTTIKDALAFFDHTQPSFNITIENSYTEEEEFTDIFLKRRSYLLFSTHSYKYAAGADGLKSWWRSITIYPHAERYMIKRMRWLSNNLSKFDQWQPFNLILEQTPDQESISLLAYVLALNPLASVEDRQIHAARLLSELIEKEQLWKNPSERRFGQVMIWDVREQITDKSLLKRAADIYFAGDSISERFQDINTILHGESANANVALVQEVLSTLEQAGKGFIHYEATAEQREAFYGVVEDSLNKANTVSTDILFQVISNLDQQEVRRRALHYLYTHNIPDKEEAFIKLYIRLEPSDHEIPDIFTGVFPKMFENASDPNLEMARKLLFIPETDYRNDYVAENARAAAVMFFLNSVHWPENFNFFMNVLKDEQYNELANLKETIFTHLLSKEYDTKINPTNQMSQEQLETMLETISNILRKRDWLGYSFIRDAIRTIYYLENPKAKDWMERHYNNRRWLNSFPNMDIGYDDLRTEIYGAIESSLEFINQ